jgi:LuxR family transcriptional regulator, maltose regulon positive regulatory protein
LTAGQDGATMIDVGATSDEADASFVGVRTKLLVPVPRPQALPRPHLVKLLDRGLTAKMSLVCAPTGWGKTSVLTSSLAGGVALGRSLYRLALGDIAGALASGQRAVELEQTRGSPEPTTANYFLGVARFFEDPEEAEPLLTGYLATVPPGTEDVRRYFAQALVAEVHILRGDVTGGERLAQEALALARSQQLEEHPPTQQVHVAIGAALHSRGELEAAEEEFERAAALAHRGGDRIENAHALVWLARVRADQGDLGGAWTALEAANSFTAGGSAHQRAVAALEQELGAAPSRRPPAEGDTLSDAELRVLRLLPSDLSYREMADYLYLSLNTVRTHSQRIRRKLAVSTRSEAVTRARELGII